MKNILLSLLLLPLLAFGAGPGDLQEGKWVIISVPTGPGSTVRTLYTATGASTGGNFANGIGAFSGGTFATGYGAAGSLLYWGGGHNDYGGNELYAFGVATGLWSKPGLQSPSGSCNYTTSLWPDGKPCAEHTWDGLVYAPTTNQMFQMPGSSDYGTVEGTSYIDAFSFTDSAWTRKGRISNGVDLSAQHESAMTAYDSQNNVIWWHGGSKYLSYGGTGTLGNILKKISVTTGDTVASYASRGFSQNGSMLYAPNLKAIIIINPRRSGAQDIAVWDVSSGTPVLAITPFTGGMIPDEAWGFAWDPIANKGVSYSGSGSSVVTLTPPANWATTHTGTWAFATVPAASGSAVPTRPPLNIWLFDRFSYAPALCGFVAVMGVDEPVWAYRLTGGAGPGCGGSPPADPLPAVSLTASPSSITASQSSTLSWQASNATNCTASIGWSGIKNPTLGSQTVTPSATTVYRLTCNGLLSQSAVTVFSEATVLVNTAGGGTADFAARCAAPGVVRCTNFDTDTDFVHYNLGGPLYPTNDLTRYPVRDTSVKSSGASSMRFTLPAFADANQSGYWLGTLWDASLVGGTAANHFTQGETFYVQFRQRMDSNFRNTDWNAFGTAPKQFILHPQGIPSCTTNQLVMVRYYDTQIPTMYTNCGAESLFVYLPDGDRRFQQGPTLDCRSRGGPGPTCKLYKADDWMTFMVRVSPGAFGQPATVIEAWMSYDGESPTQIIDLPNFVMNFQGSASEKLNMIQITPYMTARNPLVSMPVSTTWYDDLLVSTQKPAWPSGGTAFPAPTLTFSATPTSVALNGVSVLTWSTTNASSCQASGDWAGSKGAGSGISQNTEPLTVPQTFTLTCSGGGGDVTKTVSVGVLSAPPVVAISASPATVTPGLGSGSASTITWFATNATSCTSSGAGWMAGPRAVSGSVLSNSLSATSTFILSCIGQGGSNSGSTTVQVTGPGPTITSLSASPNPVDYGSRVTLSYGTTDAQSCDWPSGFPTGANAPYGVSVSLLSPVLTTTTLFTLRCTNPVSTVSRSVSVGVNPIPNPTVRLTSSKATLTAGESATLTWTTTNAASCTGTGTGFAGSRAAGGGSLSLSPGATTAYGLVCTGANGATASDSVQVIVNDPTPAPVITFSSTVAQVTSGTATTLTWSVSDATTCTASDGWSGSKSNTGSTASTGNLTTTTTFTLSCSGTGGTDIRSVTVTVTVPPSNPEVVMVASQISVRQGTLSTLTWFGQEVTSCTAADGDAEWTGSLGVSGSRVVTPTVTTTYTVSCTDGVTTDTSSVTITVSPALTVDLTVSPIIINPGGATTLSWTSSDPVAGCLFDQNNPVAGLQAADGSVSTGALSRRTEYLIRCSDEFGFGFVEDRVTVLTTPNTVERPHRRRIRRR